METTTNREAKMARKGEHKGYYSIASGRWVSHAEVVTAENTIEAMRLENRARTLRREAFEERAAEAAARGDFVSAREILAEGRASEKGVQ